LRRYLIWTIIALAILFYLFGSQAVALITDLIWFGTLGYRSVMAAVIVTQVELAVALGILFFLIVYLNVWIARRWAPPVPRLYQEIGLGERIERLARRSVDVLLLVGSAVVALLAAFEASGHWQQYLLWRNPVPFHVTDPLFHRDVGFYVFQLPFIFYLYRWLAFALIVAFLATAWVHWTDRALQFAQNMPMPRFAPHVKVHLSILLALILFTLSFGYWIRQYNLLQSDFGLFNLNGAGYTDVHARLFGLKLMAIGCVLVGVLLLVNLGIRGLTIPAVGLAALIGVSIVVGVLYPAFMQTYIVSPSDAKLEKPYIASNIDFTRQAYQLDRIQDQSYSADAPLTAQDLRLHAGTLKNIRLWDYKQLARVYNQQQGLKPYYTFPDIDVDRYAFASGYRQVMLAAREFDVSQAPQKTWIAQRLQYTHGYGAVLSTVNGVSSEGSPEYLLKDIPPQPAASYDKDLAIRKPQIYFGEADNGYAIVDTDQPEFDYPSVGGDKQVDFAGSTGIPIGSYGRKLLFSLRFGDPNFILSNLVGPKARVLIHRQIQDRVATLAPFLLQDHDPYLAIADGRLYWIVDCYTATDLYPYSQTSPLGINYLRNAVKVTVDAYDGSTKFYVFDRTDPIIQAYQRIFPSLFTPSARMPKSLLTHIRYPEDLFDIQTRLFCLYHMKDPNLFYTQSDAWALATEGSSQNEEPPPMEPYYVTMRLPDSDRMEFILIRPFTPNSKQNMSAWMAVRCDPDDYGKMIVYRFPETSLLQGPAQIEARIQQAPEISQRMSLWNTQGSHVNLGNLLVVPLNHSILYVQPLYLEAEQGPAKMPELKQVIVASEKPQRVVMASTFGEALSQLLGSNVSGLTEETPSAKPGGKTSAPTPETPLAGNATALIQAANRQMEAAERAQRAGDWAAYGKALNQLRQTLRDLQANAK
jgi:uncharacterized membrane protein (UPF0182 family)